MKNNTYINNIGFIERNVLGVKITCDKKENILEYIKKCLKEVKSQKLKVENEKVKSLVIYTPNPEIVTYADKNQWFKEIVNTAQINLPDGQGIVWAVKKLFGKEIHRITGVDFMQNLTEISAKEGFRIGLIGGKEDLALKVKERLQKMHRKLKVEILGEPDIRIKNDNVEKRSKNNLNSYFLILNSNGKEIDKKTYFKDLVNLIEKKKIDILFVALGFPKQEIFINQITFHLSPLTYHHSIVMMGVGGAFDYIAGKATRAPKAVRNAGFEWLYRLTKEPWRLGRQIKGREFFWRVWNTIKN